MSECKEEIAKHQIQAQEKIIHKLFFHNVDSSLQIKIDGIPEADKEQKQTLNYAEEKVIGVMKILQKIHLLSEFDVLENLIFSRSDEDQ